MTYAFYPTVPFYTSFDPVMTGTEGADTLYVNFGYTDYVFGLGGNDRIHLNTYSDVHVDGGEGADSFYLNGYGPVVGTLGNYDVFGGAGSDRFFVNSLNNHSLDGGSGYDRADFGALDYDLRFDLSASGAGTARAFNGLGQAAGEKITSFTDIEYLYTGSASDWVYGSSAADWVATGDGNDVIVSRGGDDTIQSGDGRDSVYLGDGADKAWAGTGDDYVRGHAGDDDIFGQDGNDTIFGGEGNDYILGGRQNDTITAGDGEDRVYGGSGDDDIRSQESNEEDHANDFFSGGIGYDTLNYTHARGGVGINAKNGQAVVDGDTPSMPDGVFTLPVIDTFTGFEQYKGSQFDDVFIGSDAAVVETFRGQAGNDLVIASDGNDDHFGGSGFDTADYSDVAGWLDLNLLAQSARVMGFEPGEQQWVDRYFGDFEKFVGTDSNDRMRGDYAENVLEGGAGNDELTGLGDQDTFLFTNEGSYLGWDTITDFQSGQDQIALTGMHNLLSGAYVDAFSALDNNDDGVLNISDANVFNAHEGIVVLFQEAAITLEGVNELTVNDFILA